MSSIYQKIKSFLAHGGQRTLTVKKNIIGSVAIKGCSILIQLLLVPMTLGYLTSELYGIWLTISSIILWLNFFDVGFTLGLKNKLSEALALNDLSRCKALVSTTYADTTHLQEAVGYRPTTTLEEGIARFVAWYQTWKN